MIRDWIDFKGIYGGVESARAKFEEACESLLRKVYPDKNVQVVRANPGDEGIDILVGEIGIQPIKVYQCKFFLDQIGSSQKLQIRKSFNTAINSKEFELEEWVLCLPKTLDITENKWWASWKKKQSSKHEISINLKNGNELIDLMKNHEVYNTFFQVETSTMIQQIHNAVVNGSMPYENIPVNRFSKDLKDWFKVLNYTFEDYLLKGESSFEWIIDVPARRRYDRIYILGVCDEAGLHHLNHIQQKVIELKCDEGWIVSTRRISQAVVDEVKHNKYENIYCYTFDELIDNDADFTGYLKWLEEQIRSKNIESKYIHLACTKDEFDSNTRKKLGQSKYNKENGGIEGYIDRWLDDPSKKHISVLGEFGTGKTWFALHYTWKLIQIYKESKAKGITRPRLPLFIPLRDYAKAVSVESLFSEFFFRKHEIPLPGYSAFEQLNKMGKFLLIFDGFDEMADKIDRQKMINNFWELARVVTDNSKVLLTCRNEHFPEAQEGRALLNAELKASVANLTGEPPQFEVLELQRLDDEQIQQLLSFYTSEENVKKVMSNQELLDLARRPVMTELIIEALPEIEAGKLIDMSRIYLYAVTRKMKRDIKEQRTFTSLADKLFFMCEISWEMLSTDTMSLNYKLFPERIRSLFGEVVQEQTNLDHWHYDMMGQTLLIRNEDGDYTPAHRSLIEFFSVYKLAAELGILAPDFIAIAKEQSNIDNSLPSQTYTWSSYFSYKTSENTKVPLSYFRKECLEKLIKNFGKILLTKTLQDLIVNIVSIEYTNTQNFLIELLKSLKGKSYQEIGYSATNAVIILLKYKYDFFRGKDLSNLCLRGLAVKKMYKSHEGLYFNVTIDFSGTNFCNSDLSYADFDNTILINAKLNNTNLKFVKYNIDYIYDVFMISSKNLLVGYGHNNLIFIDLRKKVLSKRLNGLTNIVTVLSPDEKLLVTKIKDYYSKDGFALINAQDLVLIEEYSEQFSVEDNCYEFLFFKDSNRLILAGEQKIFIWDIKSKKIIKTFILQLKESKDEEVSVYNLSLSNDEKYLLVRTSHGLQLFHIESEEFIKFDYSFTNIHDGKFHPILNQYLILEEKSFLIKIFNNDTHNLIRTITIEESTDHKLDVQEIFFNQDGSVFAIRFESKIILYNFLDGTFISRIESGIKKKSQKNKFWGLRELEPYSFEIRDVIFDTCGKQLFISSWGGYMLTFDIQSGQLINIFCSIDGVEGADFSGAKGIDKKLAEQLRNNLAIINPDNYV